jgi:electron transfer flavoprotein beta subunit
MKIVVLIKQVPAISEIALDPQTHNLVRTGAPSMMNPVDKHAVEAALKLKEAAGGGTVTIITMGSESAADIMREAIAIGANDGFLVNDPAVKGSDTLATGKVLAKAIEKVGQVDVVLTGRQSADGDTGQIPPAIAQRLGMNLLSYVQDISFANNTLKAVRKNLGGVETVEAPLPCVVSVMETSNTVRTPSLKGKMSAKKIVFPVWSLADIGLKPEEVGPTGSATKVTELFMPEAHEQGVIVKGADEAAAVKELASILRSKKVI